MKRTVIFMIYVLMTFILLNTASGYCQSSSIKDNQRQPPIDSAYKVAWLKQNAVPVRSIDSADENFSDLVPLKTIIRDAKVVFLGESTHWAGPIYHAKTRLIKFLHQEMNFDVLAYESSIDGTATTWNIMKEGKDSREAFKNAVTFGSERVELQPLRRYLEQKAASSHPLELIGFDSQMSGRLSFDSLPTQLKQYFHTIGYTAELFNDTSGFTKNLRANSQLPRSPSPPSTRYNSTFDELVDVIDSLAPKPHAFETLYYKQVLKSVKKSIQANALFQIELSGKNEQRLYTFSSNLRDEQMANNLLWYIRQYPNKKFIVSAHNTHLLTGFDPAYPAPFELDTVVKKYRWDAIQMGYLVKDSLGDKVYNIGMVSNRGSAGRIDLRDSRRNFISNFNPFDKKEPLENLLFAAGFTYAFVDLKNPPKDGEWLKGRFPLRYYTGVNFSIDAHWHKLTDGIFYIKEFTPAYVR